MIKLLQELTHNLVLLILLATFLEMLLPKNDLTKYVRLVVGLFIMLAILNSVLELFDRQVSFSLPNEEISKVQLQGILNNGEKLQNKHQEEALLVTQKRLEEQVKGMVYLIQGVGEAQVEFSFAHQLDGTLEITQGVIVIRPNEVSAVASPMIKQVDLASSSIEREVMPDNHGKLAEKVASGVSAYLGLDKNKIQVIIKTD